MFFEKLSLANRLFLGGLSLLILAVPFFFLRPRTAKDRRSSRLLVGLIFILFIAVGLVLREYKDIYINAVTLCLSCIGIK